MLQQILEKMYIDPELLAELSEDQKQMLFVKMREEQVKRWHQFEAKMEEEDKKKNKKPAKSGKKQVNFLKGRDGCEWVWIMGEHPNDKSIEQILEEEAQKTAQKLAEAEAVALREKEETELHRKMEEEKLRVKRDNEEREAKIKREQEEAALYQSIKEARLAVERMEIEKKRMEEEEKKRLAEIEKKNPSHKMMEDPCPSPIITIPSEVLEQEKRAKRRSREFAESMREKRSSEIFSTLQRKHQTLVKLAEEGSQEAESTWLEQEKKAKEADKQIRELARKARVEYKESLRRSFTMMQAAQAFSGAPASPGNKPPLPPKKHLIVTSAPGITNKKPRPLRPKGQDMIISWFQKEEKDKGTGLDPATGKVAEWFHGIINRSECEKLLESKKDGSYLIRVSERVWGYTLSYKEASRYKHFLIDASDLGYQFFGADQTVHNSLADLVKFHKENPITISGQEKLVYPCGQNIDPPDYWNLFHGKTSESTPL
ncbi:SH2 domain-containing protein 4B isoform X2 [Aplysia californica]|uniref:SH2 domain-containing protein 4B isoform X2 n=1 Tax=Aplysia californica TaxID=6500 RepID=A0ABM1VUF8_APLCA|nr:SH2 domain-containing protein 4B isoform X2 [Aplysia californica]